MEKSNADSILEIALSVVISYYLTYRLGLNFIELHNFKNIIVTTFFATQIMLMIFTYLIIKKFGYSDVLIIHKIKSVKNFFVNFLIIYVAFRFLIFILYPLLDDPFLEYCVVRINKPFTLFILCIFFALLLLIFRIYYVHTYYEKKIHFGIFIIPCMIFIFLILNSFILVIKWQWDSRLCDSLLLFIKLEYKSSI